MSFRVESSDKERKRATRCTQCGQDWLSWACGPTHAIIQAVALDPAGAVAEIYSLRREVTCLAAAQETSAETRYALSDAWNAGYAARDAELRYGAGFSATDPYLPSKSDKT